MVKIKAIWFDLDDTLFDKYSYVKVAFRDIAHFISDKYNLSFRDIYNNLKYLWEKHGSKHPRLFDVLLESLGLEVRKETVQTLVNIFHKHKPQNLEPYNDALDVLRLLKNQYTLGIITNGNVKTQKNKIKSLGIRHYFRFIIYADNSGKEFRKPHVKSYRKAMHLSRTKRGEIMYVGDDPYTDFRGAKQSGYCTVRLLRGEFAKESTNAYIDFEIRSFKGLIRLLKNMKK